MLQMIFFQYVIICNNTNNNIIRYRNIFFYVFIFFYYVKSIFLVRTFLLSVCTLLHVFSMIVFVTLYFHVIFTYMCEYYRDENIDLRMYMTSGFCGSFLLRAGDSLSFSTCHFFKHCGSWMAILEDPKSLPQM